jgi:hypothetical protein
MKCPDQVQLSRADGEALRIRLARDTLTADDRHVLDQVLQWYFWLLFALQEATFSLKRLRAMLFGEKPQKRMLALHRDDMPEDRLRKLGARSGCRLLRLCRSDPLGAGVPSASPGPYPRSPDVGA